MKLNLVAENRKKNMMKACIGYITQYSPLVCQSKFFACIYVSKEGWTYISFREVWKWVFIKTVRILIVSIYVKLLRRRRKGLNENQTSYNVDGDYGV